MTEKKQRFTISDVLGDYFVEDNSKRTDIIKSEIVMWGTYDYCEKTCNLLNELHNENEQLKHDATVLIYSNQEYRKGNEQLKSELSEKDIQLDFLKAENSHMSNLVNENKQLKQLAEGNEELLLKVMSYLHDNHYDIWEEVNKECFLKELGDD